MFQQASRQTTATPAQDGHGSPFFVAAREVTRDEMRATTCGTEVRHDTGWGKPSGATLSEEASVGPRLTSVNRNRHQVTAGRLAVSALAATTSAEQHEVGSAHGAASGNGGCPVTFGEDGMEQITIQQRIEAQAEARHEADAELPCAYIPLPKSQGRWEWCPVCGDARPVGSR